MTFIQELKRLMDAATKGPWEWADSYTSLRTVETYGTNETKVIDGKNYTSFALPEFILDCEQIYGETGKANAELIAYLVNHAPAIAELVEITQEYYDAQQEWAKYRLALDNAEANYSDSAPDEKLFMGAVLRVNEAEHALSEALAKLEEQ